MRELSQTTKMHISKYISQDINKISYAGLFKIANADKGNYSFEDILNYLVNFQYNIFTTNKSCSKKQIEKYGAFTYEIINKEKSSEIDNILISKIIKLKDEYETYCKNNNEDISKPLLDCYIAIANCYQVTNNNEVASQLLEYGQKIQTLEAEKKELNEQISSLNKKVNKIQNSKEQSEAKKDNKIQEKENDIKELKKEIKSLKNELEKSKKNSSLNNEEYNKKLEIVSKLSEKLQEYELLNQSLTSENNAMINRNMELNNTINKLNNSSAFKLEQEQIKNAEFDSIITKILVTNKYTAEELFNYLNSNGIACDFNDIYSSLKRIQKEINIEPTGEITIPKLYEVQKPEFITDKQIILNPINGKYKDILFISDLHIGNNIDEDIYMFKRLYGMYDYCMEKGIDTIINLGDIIDSDELKNNKTYDRFIEHKQHLENVNNGLNNSRILSSNISQLILGGNHDRDFARYGIDPIKYLADNNPTLIPIGYEDARIKIATTEDYIGLHHSGVPREETLNNDHQKITAETLSYLKNYYNRLNIDQKNIYFDFFGHTHKGKIDPQNAYSIIPSFNHDRFTDGATKVRIYFDDNGNIDYLLLYPLSIGKRIEQISEIPYQRKKAL